jgi:prefoldin subunit 5
MKRSRSLRGTKDFMNVVRSLEETTKKLEQTSSSLHAEVKNTEQDTRDLYQVMQAAQTRNTVSRKRKNAQ